MVSGSVMLPRLPLLSFYFAILAMFLPRSCLLWSTADLSSHVPHSAVCRSMIKGAYLFQLFLFFFFFLSGKGNFPTKPPADFLMGDFNRNRLFNHAPAVGRLVKQASATFSLCTGRWAFLRKDGRVEVALISLPYKE